MAAPDDGWKQNRPVSAKAAWKNWSCQGRGLHSWLPRQGTAHPPRGTRAGIKGPRTASRGRGAAAAGEPAVGRQARAASELGSPEENGAFLVVVVLFRLFFFFPLFLFCVCLVFFFFLLLKKACCLQAFTAPAQGQGDVRGTVPISKWRRRVRSVRGGRGAPGRAGHGTVPAALEPPASPVCFVSSPGPPWRKEEPSAGQERVGTASRPPPPLPARLLRRGPRLLSLLGAVVLNSSTVLYHNCEMFRTT